MFLKQLFAEIDDLENRLAAPDGGARLMERMGPFLQGLREYLHPLERELETRHAEELQMEMALCFSEDAVSITTPAGEIRMVNPAFERLTGYSGAEIMGKTHGILWISAPAEAVAALKTSTDKGGQWRGELAITRKDGETALTELSAIPIISPSGAPANFVFIQRNITRRRQMEKKLVEQKSLLEKVMNLTSNTIAVIGPDGQWELDNISAKTLLSDMGRGSRKRLAEQLLKEIGARGTVKDHKMDIPLANGAVSRYLMEAERIPARYLLPDSGAGNLYLITLADITQIESKNREILVRQKALSASKIEQGLAQTELANGFIYRVRQPLNVGMAICGRMEELLRKNDRESLEITVQLMRGELEKMEMELVQFKHISTPPEVRGRCAAREVAEGLELLYRERAAATGIKLEVENAANGACVPIAEELLQLVLIKLLDNAFDSVETLPAPRVKLTLKHQRQHIGITVEDNGPGITEGERFTVFEPLHSTKSNHTGLSLALVHQLVSRSGGWITIEKSGLGGTCFAVILPLAEEPCTT